MYDDTKPVTHRPKRRNHTAQFKAQVVALCQQPHVSMASVARAHDLNANLLRRWVSDHQRQQLRREPCVEPTPLQRHATQTPPDAAPDRPPVWPTPGFIALSASPLRGMPATASRPAAVVQTEPVQVELMTGAWHMRVHWPGQRLDALAPWLRALTTFSDNS